MKRILNCFVTGTMLLASCSKVSPELIELSDSRSQLIVEAGLSESFTRSGISEEDSTVILWSPRDSFSMFYQDQSSIFRSDSLRPTRRSRFRGYIEVASAEYDNPSFSDYFYGIYPHKSCNSVQSGQFVFDIDSVQRAVPNSYDPMAFPAIARSQNLSLAFYNVCGGMMFTLRNSDVRSIVVSAEGHNIAGRVRADFDDEGKPGIVDFVNGASSIVLRAPGDSVFIPGVRYYISMAPSVLSDGFSVTFYKKSRYASYSYPKAVTVKRGVFGQLRDIDKDVEFVVNVDSLTLDTHQFNLDMDESLKLNATITPEDASDKTVIWTSSDEGVATVDAAGLVTPVSPGTVKVFATSRANPDVKDSCCLVVFKLNNLCVDGTANCYIVSKSGRYKFKVLRGVAGTSLGSVASAALLWHFKEVDYNMAYYPVTIIDNVALSDDRQWVTFSVPDSIVEGSAVVAVRDAYGKILWSWHIWVAVDYDPEATAQTYANGAGTVMSRNLGSCSASGPNYTSPGMYYQWGRKDPFPGWFAIPIRYVAGNLDWPSPVASSQTTGTIEYTIANPMTYLTTSDPYRYYDWYYSETFETTRWNETQKTDYDPCPVGWKVPVGGNDGLWAVASGSTSKLTGSWDSVRKGMYLESFWGTSGSCWYGSTGKFYASDGSTGATGIVGCYWSCSYSTSQQRAECLYIDNGGSIYPVYYGKAADAMSVRCVKEND